MAIQTPLSAGGVPAINNDGSEETIADVKENITDVHDSKNNVVFNDIHSSLEKIFKQIKPISKDSIEEDIKPSSENPIEKQETLTSVFDPLVKSIENLIETLKNIFNIKEERSAELAEEITYTNAKGEERSAEFVQVLENGFVQLKKDNAVFAVEMEKLSDDGKDKLQKMRDQEAATEEKRSEDDEEDKKKKEGKGAFEGIINFFKTIKKVMSTVLLKILPIIVGIGALLKTLFGEGGEGAFNALVDAFFSILTSMKDLVMGVIDAFQPVVKFIVTEVVPKLAEMIQRLIPPIVAVFEKIAEVFAKVLPPIIDFLIPTIEAVINTIMFVINQFATSFSAAIDFFRSILSGDFENALRVLVDLFSDTVDNVRKWLSSLPIIGKMFDDGSVPDEEEQKRLNAEQKSKDIQTATDAFAEGGGVKDKKGIGTGDALDRDAAANQHVSVLEQLVIRSANGEPGYKFDDDDLSFLNKLILEKRQRQRENAAAFAEAPAAAEVSAIDDVAPGTEVKPSVPEAAAEVPAEEPPVYATSLETAQEGQFLTAEQMQELDLPVPVPQGTEPPELSAGALTGPLFEKSLAMNAGTEYGDDISPVADLKSEIQTEIDDVLGSPVDGLFDPVLEGIQAIKDWFKGLFDFSAIQDTLTNLFAEVGIPRVEFDVPFIGKVGFGPFYPFRPDADTVAIKSTIKNIEEVSDDGSKETFTDNISRIGGRDQDGIFSTAMKEETGQDGYATSQVSASFDDMTGKGSVQFYKEGDQEGEYQSTVEEFENVGPLAMGVVRRMIDAGATPDQVREYLIENEKSLGEKIAGFLAPASEAAGNMLGKLTSFFGAGDQDTQMQIDTESGLNMTNVVPDPMISPKTDQLQSDSKEVADNKTGASAAIVTAPTMNSSVVNNNSSTTIMQTPNVRPTESSVNRITDQNLSSAYG